MKTPLKMFVWMVVLTGFLYPLVLTALAQLTMPHRANGDLIEQKGKTLGSTLIGQKFVETKYFWPRPSAINYDPLPSGGSNLGPTSAALKKLVEERRARIDRPAIPSELLFASASGVDPHISIETAYFQIERVAKARGIEAEKIKRLVDSHIEKWYFRLLRNPYINVLELNLALDNQEYL